MWSILTFIGPKDTEEYWEEQTVEGAAAAAAPAPKPSKPTPKPAVPPAKKKTKKGAGSRDIMSFFSK